MIKVSDNVGQGVKSVMMFSIVIVLKNFITYIYLTAFQEIKMLKII